jgi:hypothetical protein
LRENQGRAANTDVTELTVVKPANIVRVSRGDGAGRPESTLTDRRPFPKVSVPLIGYKSKKQLIVIAAIVAAMLLTGAGLALRSRNAGLAAPNAITGPSPSPTVEPSASPSPSPSPTASPKPVKKPTPTKKPEGNSFFNKSKRALKKLNPFKIG